MDFSPFSPSFLEVYLELSIFYTFIFILTLLITVIFFHQSLSFSCILPPYYKTMVNFLLEDHEWLDLMHRIQLVKVESIACAFDDIEAYTQVTLDVPNNLKIHVSKILSVIIAKDLPLIKVKYTILSSMLLSKEIKPTSIYLKWFVFTRSLWKWALDSSSQIHKNCA